MPELTTVSLDMYQEVQWAGIVADMTGLIADDMVHPDFINHHARKRGVTYDEACAALIEAQEEQS